MYTYTQENDKDNNKLAKLNRKITKNTLIKLKRRSVWKVVTDLRNKNGGADVTAPAVYYARGTPES